MRASYMSDIHPSEETLCHSQLLTAAFSPNISRFKLALSALIKNSKLSTMHPSILPAYLAITAILANTA
jgi:hypothetical protein